MVAEVHSRSDSVLTSIADGVLLITINRPPANAIDAPTSRLLGHIFAAFRDDPSLRAAILTGGNSRFFSAGWDLKAAAQGEPPNADFGIGGFGGFMDLPALDKPVIAAVNGIAAGGGFEIALAADIIVCADTAKLALPGVAVGALPETASVLLPRRVPHHIAMELLLTGRWFTPEEAAAWGCCNVVVPAINLKEKAMEIGRAVVRGAPLVQAAVKQIARETQTMADRAALDLVRAHALPSIETLYTSTDFHEGTRAFVEKRSPVWKGV